MNDMTSTREYLKDPAEIYRLSFQRIAEEASLDHLPDSLRGIATRMIHACGMTDLVEDIAWSGEIAHAVHEALERAAPILCDSKMLANGINLARLVNGSPVICLIDDPRATELASAVGTTRSAACVDLWADRIEGAIVAIGNAPTALFRLLDVIEAGGRRPSALIALPVGFVGAAEAKEALIEAKLGIPYLTLRGRRGGSAMAAAAINAIVSQAS